MLPFSSSWAVFFFLILIIYGTGIGREHFYYSYAPQSTHDVFDYIEMIIISFIIFIPLGVLVAFIDLNDFTLDVNFPELYGAIAGLNVDAVPLYVDKTSVGVIILFNIAVLSMVALNLFPCVSSSAMYKYSAILSGQACWFIGRGVVNNLLFGIFLNIPNASLEEYLIL